MNNNDKIKKSTIESIIVISIMALYMIYGIHFVPILLIFIPLPFVVLGIRNGIYTNIISIIVSSIIVGVFLGISSAASLILIFAPLSLALNYCISNRKSSTETLLICTAAFFFSFLLLISFEGKVLSLNLTKQLEDNFRLILNMQIDMLNEMGMTKHEILQTADLLEKTYKAIIVLIPSLIGVFALVISFANLYLSSIVLKRMRYGIISLQRFSRFRLPNNIIPGIGIMFLAAFIAKKLDIQYHEALLFNLTFLVGFIFFIQGLAVLDFLLIKAKIRLIFRILILSLNIIFVPISSIMFFIGLLDTIFDIRKIRR